MKSSSKKILNPNLAWSKAKDDSMIKRFLCKLKLKLGRRIPSDDDLGQMCMQISDDIWKIPCYRLYDHYGLHDWQKCYK